MDSTLTGVQRWGGTGRECSLLEIRRDDGVDADLRVWLVGEVDMAVTAELAQDLGRLAELRRPVRLDLSRLRFIDGRGLATLVSAVTKARAAGCDVEVEPVLSPAVELVVTLSGVASMLWPVGNDRALNAEPALA